ncbi:RomA, partial [Giardia duodenalis]
VWQDILMQAAWQVMAAETVISTGRGATQSSPVLCRGTACTAAPLQRAVCWPPCVCGRLAAECARLAAGLRGDGGQLLLLLPWLTKRRPVCGQHTEATARGAATQRHRSASLVEEKPASREAPQQCTSRRPRSAALARRCVPVKKSCSSRW